MFAVKEGGEGIMTVVGIYPGIIFGDVVYVIERMELGRYTGVSQDFGPDYLPVFVIAAGRRRRAGVYGPLGGLVVVGMGFAISGMRGVYASGVFAGAGGLMWHNRPPFPPRCCTLLQKPDS
jgi:hypothetical protein